MAPTSTRKRAGAGSPPSCGRPPKGMPRRFEVLLEAGAQINARSNAGWTALLFAAREGKIPAVKALLAGGADVNDALLAASWPRPWCGRGGRRRRRRPAAPNPRIQRARARGRQRPLRTGGSAARCGSGSERGCAGLDRAPSHHMDSQAGHGQQRSCAVWLGQHGQPDAGQEAESPWRRCERAG